MTAPAPLPDPTASDQPSAADLAGMPLQVLEPEPFVVLPQPVDLRRFSRYWKLAVPRLRPDRAGTDTFS
ncbi:MAG: hypothetical protein NTW83_05205 [Cyanobacteria bacterium]|nr:hypothetical protein [Cyanobacteriota bacterium]